MLVCTPLLSFFFFYIFRSSFIIRAYVDIRTMRSKPESNFIMSYLFSRFSDVFRLWCNTPTPGVCVWVCVSERVSSVYFSPYWRRWLTTIGKKTKQFSNWNAILFSFFHFWRFVIFFFILILLKGIVVIGESCPNFRWRCWELLELLFSFPPLLLLLLLLIWGSVGGRLAQKPFFTKEKSFPGKNKNPASRWRWWTEDRPSMGFLWNSSEKWWSWEAERP